ncbi:hypothetical protein [Vibrio agarivorans]|uniref:Nucleotide pyrophosphatase n=1 Tax=Vibrio agarivorans TaxID=153622 RepID=A0ABT7Y4F7_9VIBR|nr:hypothetical protein [Vibrio agarivorans]MDN2482933.1 hypothetical protein [Vibrio agarivorans]
MIKLTKCASGVAAILALAGCNSSSDGEVTPDPIKERKSLLVMIDGTRYEALLNANTPNLDKLAIQQAYTGGISGTLSQSGTSTVEGESTLWTGSWHTIQKSGEEGFKTVWEHIKAEKEDFQIGLYPNWPIFDYVNFNLSEIEHKKAFRTGTDRDAEHENSAVVAEKILSGDYDSLFTTIDMVDYSGHCNYGNSGGAWSDDYVKTIEEADTIFGYMLDAVEQREAEFDEEWLIMVAPDHGFNRQKDNGSVDCAHGSQDIDAKKIWVASSHEELLNEQFTSPLSAVGNRDKDGIYRYVAQTDVTPTMLTWHNVEIQPEWEIEGTPLIGEIGVRGLFVETSQESNLIELQFTPSNNLPVQVLVNGEEVEQLTDTAEGELYTFTPNLDHLEPGHHQIVFTLINNSIPKSISASFSIIEDVDYDDLPFNTITALYAFDDELTDNAVSGGENLKTTGNPEISHGPGKYGQSLYHVRNFNNDLLLEDTVTNTDKFTLSLWFVGDGTSYDPAVITNKRWASSADGMILAQLNDSLKLQVGVDGEGSCCFVQLPYTPTTNSDDLKWNLLVASVDKTLPWSNGEGFGVMTFGVYDANGDLHYGSVDLTGSRTDTIHTGQPWLINNDHAQSYNNGHAALLDELVIWQDSTFNPGEVIALGKAENSVIDKLTSATTSTATSLEAEMNIPYIGGKPNMTESELKAEAFWQRRRQMEELKAELGM